MATIPLEVEITADTAKFDAAVRRVVNRLLQARIEQLEDALRTAIAELGGQHSGHFDPTGGSGRGCPVCIAEHETKEILRRVLNAWTPEEVNDDEQRSTEETGQ